VSEELTPFFVSRSSRYFPAMDPQEITIVRQRIGRDELAVLAEAGFGDMVKAIR
jgi:hypothetical protein